MDEKSASPTPTMRMENGSLETPTMAETVASMSLMMPSVCVDMGESKAHTYQTFMSHTSLETTHPHIPRTYNDEQHLVALLPRRAVRGGGGHPGDNFLKIGWPRQWIRADGALVGVEDALDAHHLGAGVVAVERKAVAGVVPHLGPEAKGREGAVRVVVLEDLADRQYRLHVRVGRLVERGRRRRAAAGGVRRDEVEGLRVGRLAVGGGEVDGDLGGRGWRGGEIVSSKSNRIDSHQSSLFRGHTYVRTLKLIWQPPRT